MPHRPGAPSTRNRGHFVAVVVLLVAITGAVYGQTGNHAFVAFDDEAYVADNPPVRGGLTGSGILWAFSTLWMGNYHPVTWLSHMTDVTVFGMDAGSHHLVNLFFHGLNTLLVFYLLFRMTKAMGRSAFVAALFAVHPLHVESVAWIAERKDLLSAFFFLVTIWAYLRFTEKRTVRRYMAVFVSAAMGLLSKAMLVTLPFVLVLLDYWPLGRLGSPGADPERVSTGAVPAPWKTIVLEKLPLLGLSIAACAIALAAQGGAGATDASGAYPLGFRLANALISYGTYLAKTFWPSSLAVYYPYPAQGLAAWKIVLAGSAVLALTVLAVRERRRRPFLAVGWFWYLGTLVPVIGLVQVGEQAMADRYTYIPLVGIFIALVWGTSGLLSGKPVRSRILAAAGGAAVAVLAALSWIQAGYWRSSGTLFEHALQVTSDNWMMRNNLGVVRFQEGRRDEALRHYAEAVRISPNFALANFNLGDALLAMGKTNQSVGSLRRAVDLAPRNAIMRLTLGTALARQGKLDEGLSHLWEAARLDPGNQEVQRALGTVLSRKGPGTIR